MRETKKKGNIFAKRGFFITLVAITSVMVIAVIMNLVIPPEEVSDSFDSESWQEAVRQVDRNPDTGLVNVYQEPASPANANAVPDDSAEAGRKETPPGDTREVPGGTQAPAAQAWEENGEDKPEASEQPQSSVLLENPVAGAIAKDFSADELVYSETMEDWRVHEGIDFAAQEGEEVRAAADGVIESSVQEGMLGACVIISHPGGIQSVYGNLREGSALPEGTQVKTGQVIGQVGNSAALEIAEQPHLHFEVLRDGQQENPHNYLSNTVMDDE